jgi:ankyrin repeat protein
MAKAQKRTLDDLLQSTSDVLFPAELGARSIGVTSANGDGDTPLHVMAWRKDPEAMALLISAGAEVNAVGDMGETPLHVAIAQRDEASIRMLLDAGARIDIRSEFDETPLEKAEAKGEVVANLLRPHCG